MKRRLWLVFAVPDNAMVTILGSSASRAGEILSGAGLRSALRALSLLLQPTARWALEGRPHVPPAAVLPIHVCGVGLTVLICISWVTCKAGAGFLFAY